MELKDRLRAQRLALGLTLDDVAKVVGVSKQTVQRYESGRISNIPSDKIEKLAAALHTTPGSLMGWEDSDVKDNSNAQSDPGNREIMAKNIRHYMAINGVSRTQLCKDLGIKYTTFADWVNGNTYPRIDRIEMMAKYFGVTKADLVEGQENRGYYLNEETAALAEKLRTNEDLRVLFKASEDLDPEALKEAYNYIKYLKSKERK